MNRGIDVSHFQLNINWTKLYQSLYIPASQSADGFQKIPFVICKASQGISYNDYTFRSKMQAAKEAGFILGAYHFYDPKKDGLEQAKFFLEQLKLEHFPILIALDVEQYDGWDRLNTDQIKEEVEDKWLTTVQKAINGQPLLYTNPAFASQYLTKVNLRSYPIWISAYSKNIPDEYKDCAIWQSTGEGHVDGYNGNLDIDTYEGSNITKLLAWGPLTIPS